MKKIILLSFSIFCLFGINAKSYDPTDLKAPVFEGNGMVINPDNLIDKSHVDLIVSLRKTYFFGRYVEPIIVSVDKINGSGEDFIDGLIKYWKLESKTNGRFIVQLRVGEFNKFYFKAGSQIEKFYSKSFFRCLNNEYAKSLSADNNGTYDYVVHQKVGSEIFEQISFDSDLDYDNNDILPFYPSFVHESHGDLIIHHYKKGGTMGVKSSNTTPIEEEEIENISIMHKM